MVYNQGKTWMNGASRLNGTLTSRILLMEGTSQITSNTTPLDNMCPGWEDHIPPPPPPPPLGSCKILFGDGGIQGLKNHHDLPWESHKAPLPDGSYIRLISETDHWQQIMGYCGNNTKCVTSGEYLGR